MGKRDGEQSTGRTGTRHRLRIGAVAVAAAVATALLLLPATAGAAKKVPTTVKLTGADLDFVDDDAVWALAGKVKSPKAKCERGRKVKLSHDGETVGKTTTSKTGAFLATFPISTEGSLDTKAKVAKKEVGKGKRKRVCKPDTATMHLLPAVVEITIDFDDALDRFSGFASGSPDCLLGNQWILFKDSTDSEPIAFGDFNAGGNPWDYDYGSQPPSGTYIVATGFRSFSTPVAGGDLNLTACFNAIAEVTV
jgi:hypothetical protein